MRVCLYVCYKSVFTKTAKCRMTQTTPHFVLIYSAAKLQVRLINLLLTSYLTGTLVSVANAYRMAPMSVTLNDLEVHSSVAGLFKCNPSNICAAFYQISTDSMLARSLSDSWASCTKCRVVLQTLQSCL